jgi:tRNA threonylcarbamoyladenosine biosynthesis protein TsaE
LVPILNPNVIDLISNNASQTRRFGHRLGLLLQPGDIICLEGDLGTGKTCFVQGIGQALGVREAITSPTFTLIGEYRGQHQTMPLFHLDIYRLDDPAELDELGVWEYLYDDGVCAIEWADRIRDYLPHEALWVSLRHYLDENRRGLILEGYGDRYESLLRDFKRSAFGV